MAKQRLTFPQEHGALVTLLGAALLAALVAPRPEIALAAATVFTAAYLARGPIERKVKRLKLRPFDLPALLAYAIAATAALAIVARERPMAGPLVGALAAAIPIAGALTRSAKLRRSILLEAGGMFATGASVGASVYAGDAAVLRSLTLATALATYSAASILIVRAQTRSAERRDRAKLTWQGVAVLALGAGVCAALEPRVALAFVPRGAHALIRTRWVRHAQRIGRVALRESLELGVFVILIAVVT